MVVLRISQHRGLPTRPSALGRDVGGLPGPPPWVAMDSNAGVAGEAKENGDGDEADDHEDPNEAARKFFSLSLSSVSLFLSLKIPLSPLFLCLFLSKNPTLSHSLFASLSPVSLTTVSLSLRFFSSVFCVCDCGKLRNCLHGILNRNF